MTIVYLKFAGATALAAAICFVTPAPTNAQTHPLDSYFNGETNSCYRRTYSEKHLLSHTDQSVEKISFEHYPRDIGVFDENNQVRFDEQTREVYFSISVTFRLNNKVFSEGGTCRREGDHLQCGIECDGGGFQLFARKGNRLLLKTGEHGFVVVAENGGCGGDTPETDIVMVTRKTDDKAFLLDLAPVDQCVYSGSVSK